MEHQPEHGFTLVELLVVISVISLLTGILLQVLGKVRSQTRVLLGMNNQRQIAAGVNHYASDNDECYPESMATITQGNSWHWQEPTMLTACRPRPLRARRSMSAYLRSYIEEASILFCPSAPREYRYLQEAWDAGDGWDNPETSFDGDDQVLGTYCFYWNYIGFLGYGEAPFRGPRSSLGGRGQSNLLVSDYFGYDHWRSPQAYGSCERLAGGTITPGTEVSSAYWSRPSADANPGPDTPGIRLHAGYTDGHVESFTASEVVPMTVSMASDGSAPYLTGVGLAPGDFYVPRKGLR